MIVEIHILQNATREQEGIVQMRLIVPEIDREFVWDSFFGMGDINTRERRFTPRAVQQLTSLGGERILGQAIDHWYRKERNRVRRLEEPEALFNRARLWQMPEPIQIAGRNPFLAIQDENGPAPFPVPEDPEEEVEQEPDFDDFGDFEGEPVP